MSAPTSIETFWTHLDGLFDLHELLLDSLENGQRFENTLLVIVQLFGVRGGIDCYPCLVTLNK